MVLLLPTTISIVFLAIHTEAAGVTLFSKMNFTGNRCDISFPGCKPVCAQVLGTILSLKAPTRLCMKFFKSADCKGGPPMYISADRILEYAAPGWPDLRGTPHMKAKAIGDCSLDIGIPDETVALFPDRYFKGKPCIVPVNGKCQAVCPDMAGKSKSLIANVKCSTLWATKNCTGEPVYYTRDGEKGVAYDYYDNYGVWANFPKISSISNFCG